MERHTSQLPPSKQVYHDTAYSNATHPRRTNHSTMPVPSVLIVRLGVKAIKGTIHAHEDHKLMKDGGSPKTRYDKKGREIKQGAFYKLAMAAHQGMDSRITPVEPVVIGSSTPVSLPSCLSRGFADSGRLPSGPPRTLLQYRTKRPSRCPAPTRHDTRTSQGGLAGTTPTAATSYSETSKTHAQRTPVNTRTTARPVLQEDIRCKLCSRTSNSSLQFLPAATRLLPPSRPRARRHRTTLMPRRQA